jgi:hypothetical protein
MRIHRLFQQGDMVQIINHQSPLYGMILTVDSIQSGKYFVALGGQKNKFFLHDLGPWLGYHFHKKLYKAHLIQMQILAVDVGDRAWFDEIGEVIKKFDYLP